MKHYTFTDSLEKSAQQAINSYLNELESYKKFVPKSEFESIKDEIISHLEEKLASGTNSLSTQEVQQVLSDMGTPRELLQDYNVPDSALLRKQTLFRKGITYLLVIIFSIVLATYANIVIQQNIPHQGEVYLLEKDDFEKQKVLIQKHPIQKLIIRFQNSSIESAYVYQGENLQDNQVYIEFHRAPVHDYVITYEKGNMVVTFLPRINETPINFEVPAQILVFIPVQNPYFFDASQTIIDSQIFQSSNANQFDPSPNTSNTSVYFEYGLTAIRKELRDYDEIDMWANVLDIESQYSQIVLKPQSFSFAGWNW